MSMKSAKSLLQQADLEERPFERESKFIRRGTIGAKARVRYV